MRWTKRNLLTLCLAVATLYFGQYASTASIKGRDVLASLIKSRVSCDILKFQNQRIQPDVQINGTEVLKCTGGTSGPCIVGNTLVLPPNFCSPSTYATLYPGDPPSPQNFTGSEVCNRFPNVEPTHKSEENSCSCGYIFGYVFGIFGLLVLLLLIACYVFGLCHYNWEWLKKKEEVREKDDLKFGEPQNQQDVGHPNGGQSNVVPDNFGGEEGVDGKQPGAVPNIFDHFLNEVEMILREAKEGVLTILSLPQVCRRAGCELAAYSHHLFDMHVKLGNTEVAINCATCPLKSDLENKAKEMISYKEDSCRSKYFQGFLFHHNTIADSFDLSRLESQIEGEDVSLYKVEMASGTEPNCFKMFKKVLHILIREQAARLSDYPVSETNVRKTVDAVTGEDPGKTATVLGNTLRRNQSSRSMVRSDGGERLENTPPQDDTPKPFTGEQSDFEATDDA